MSKNTNALKKALQDRQSKVPVSILFSTAVVEDMLSALLNKQTYREASEVLANDLVKKMSWRPKTKPAHRAARNIYDAYVDNILNDNTELMVNLTKEECAAAMAAIRWYLPDTYREKALSEKDMPVPAKSRMSYYHIGIAYKQIRNAYMYANCKKANVSEFEQEQDKMVDRFGRKK